MFLISATQQPYILVQMLDFWQSLFALPIAKDLTRKSIIPPPPDGLKVWSYYHSVPLAPRQLTLSFFLSYSCSNSSSSSNCHSSFLTTLGCGCCWRRTEQQLSKQEERGRVEADLKAFRGLTCLETTDAFSHFLFARPRQSTLLFLRYYCSQCACPAWRNVFV